jgi:hypothetical protein
MKLSVDCVIDIEAENWDTFVTGALYSPGRVVVERDPDRFTELVYSLPKGTQVWAHAGGRYDFLFLLSRRIPFGARVTLSGSSVSTIKIPDGPVLRDSYRLVPMSLAKAASIAGASKGNPGLPCRCGSSCGGYCSISRRMSEADYRKVEAYLVQDCEVLYAILSRLMEYSEKHGIELRSTIGGAAWRTAKAWAGLPDANIAGSVYDFLRRGYYGGRTEVGRTRSTKGHRYDIHSSYPAALSRIDVPSGRFRHVDGAAARQAYANQKEGVYSAEVSWSDTASPPLPFRLDGRLFFPAGRFHGHWTGLELRNAERLGARIISVSEGIVFDEMLSIAPFTRRVWELRASAEKEGNAGLSTWLKLFANSLTGKFAQSPEVESAILSNHCPPGDGWRWGGGPVWFRTSRRLSPCCHVVWAAYLTAAARAELLEQIIHAGTSWTYSDTDSVFSERALSRRIGPGLGEWGHEGEYVEWECVAPKVYRYRVPGGKTVTRAKGMSGINSAGFDALASGGAWTADKGVVSFKSAAAKGRFFERAKLVRTLRPRPGWVGGRVLLPDGTTRAPLIKEIERAFA